MATHGLDQYNGGKFISNFKNNKIKIFYLVYCIGIYSEYHKSIDINHIVRLKIALLL
jgi:hypothetical protein